MNDYILTINKVKYAEKEAHRILSKHNQLYKSRVISLDDLSRQLDVLPIDVKDYFSEATKCLENGFSRASIIMAWAGFFYVFSSRLYELKENSIREKRVKWKFETFEEFRENNSEAQIIDVAKEVRFINKADLKVYQGYLSIRNKCAHPTLYQPKLNLAIGYIDELLTLTIGYFNDKSLNNNMLSDTPDLK